MIEGQLPLGQSDGDVGEACRDQRGSQSVPHLVREVFRLRRIRRDVLDTDRLGIGTQLQRECGSNRRGAEPVQRRHALYRNQAPLEAKDAHVVWIVVRLKGEGLFNVDVHSRLVRATVRRMLLEVVRAQVVDAVIEARRLIQRAGRQ